MKKVLSIVLSLVIIVSTFCTSNIVFAADTTTVTVKYLQTDARNMLKKVNSFRTGDEAWYWDENNSKKVKCKNLSKLTYDYDLEKVAMLRAAELVKNFSHTRPNGEWFYTAYNEKGYKGFSDCSENIAWVVSSDPFTGWKEDKETYEGQGHRRTMLSSNYTAIGIAGVYYNGKYYWVQEFSDTVVNKTKTPANDKETKVKIELSKPTENSKKSNKKTLILSKTSYTYDGKVKKPVVTVKNADGNTLAKTNYTVKYSKDRKNVGKYTVTVKFKGFYSGTLKKTFTIKPKTTTISKVTAGKKAFTVKWKKQTTQTTGYQIQYSTNSNFKNAKTVTISKNNTTSKKISNLKAKKKYYVRVRTYKTVKVNGKNTKIYSSWSKSKTVTTKK